MECNFNVLMWLCVMPPALCMPTPKRLPEPLALVRQGAGHRAEVLAGRDFLSVFMRTSSSRSASRHHAATSDFSENTNSVQQLHRVEGEERDINQKGENVLEATDYAEDFESARNFNSRDRFTEDRHRPLPSSPTTPVTETPTTTTTETPTTTPEPEGDHSTFYDLDEENPSEIGGPSGTERSFANYWAS
ncbi:hypothetical protein LSTR_LSTR014772 [Laodelphax striatellus]|uniref:Uncharacterized protein n=1 Tax=Laodelphax striatellus TaxID=195883 RepID=A0A482X505_LAOST|nr:hypothetical protein LSTR_LSTR014772 [Laodelphax striatellus]